MPLFTLGHAIAAKVGTGSSPAHRSSAQPHSPKPDQDDPGYCASRADRKVHELRMPPRSPILANFEQGGVVAQQFEAS